MVKPLTGDDAQRAYDLGEDLKVKDAERKRRRNTWIEVAPDDLHGSSLRRIEVPGGWVYLVNGHYPEFVRSNHVDPKDYPEDYVKAEDIPF